ncbi:MAG: hypothetical protein WD768_07300 [Phycisphaeraceae bacterium]
MAEMSELMKVARYMRMQKKSDDAIRATLARQGASAEAIATILEQLDQPPLTRGGKVVMGIAIPVAVAACAVTGIKAGSATGSSGMIMVALVVGAGFAAFAVVFLIGSGILKSQGLSIWDEAGGKDEGKR